MHAPETKWFVGQVLTEVPHPGHVCQLLAGGEDFVADAVCRVKVSSAQTRGLRAGRMDDEKLGS
jgi:hypothetical protein